MGSNILIDFYSNLLICICVKEQILQLRKEGKSYRQIQKLLNCSKSTISYHCGNEQKEKTKIRLRNHKKTLNNILKRKKDSFSVLNRTDKSRKKRSALKFSSNEFKEKITSNPICYLTGRKIDLFKPLTYHCDHIIPISKGGSNELDNLGVLCKEANIAKSNLSIDSFIELCKDVLVHNGYKVEK